MTDRLEDWMEQVRHHVLLTKSHNKSYGLFCKQDIMEHAFGPRVGVVMIVRLFWMCVAYEICTAELVSCMRLESHRVSVLDGVVAASRPSYQRLRGFKEAAAQGEAGQRGKQRIVVF